MWEINSASRPKGKADCNVLLTGGVNVAADGVVGISL